MLSRRLGGDLRISDWLANFNMIPVPWGPGWVHMGFLSQFQDQQADLDTQLDSLTRGGVNDILITGHSLGGALSWLATYYIKNRYPSATVEVLTFAAPLATSTGFMNWIYSNVAHHNHVMYQYDPVPCVPPGYTEQGQMRHYTALRSGKPYGGAGTRGTTRACTLAGRASLCGTTPCSTTATPLVLAHPAAPQPTNTDGSG
jgi:hypothetical protein